MTCDCNIVERIAVGKLQRQTPLPVGRYWFDVLTDERQSDFGEWAATNSNAVRLLKTEHFDELSWPDCPITEDCGPSRDWVLFDVVMPVDWEAELFGGFPEIVGVNDVINSSSDTVSNPAITPDSDASCDIGCQAEKVGGAAAVVAGALVIIAIVKAVQSQ